MATAGFAKQASVTIAIAIEGGRRRHVRDITGRSGTWPIEQAGRGRRELDQQRQRDEHPRPLVEAKTLEEAGGRGTHAGKPKRADRC